MAASSISVIYLFRVSRNWENWSAKYLFQIIPKIELVAQLNTFFLAHETLLVAGQLSNVN